MRLHSKIDIRRLREKEIPEICRFGNKIKELGSSKRTKFYTKSELKEWIENPKNHILLVAESSGKIIGFINAQILSKDWCMIDSLGVAEEFRGMGIGSMLLDCLYVVLKKQKITYVQGLVGEKYSDSIRFWKDKGFESGKKYIWIEREI